MIRPVDLNKDVEDIACIYEWYVRNTTVTFEENPPSREEMADRIRNIISEYPCLVWEDGGRVKGYCYVHRWKSFSAYNITLETTVYIAREEKGKGIGSRLMAKLIEECRKLDAVSLIACVTADNEESCRFHEKLGFEKVSKFRKVGSKFNRLLDVVDYQYFL